MRISTARLKMWLRWNFDGVTARFLLRNIHWLLLSFLGIAIAAGALHMDPITVTIFLIGYSFAEAAAKRLNVSRR